MIKTGFKLVLLVFLINACQSKQEKYIQPNIVLFFVDDLGWADLGYRNSMFKTPHIDQLKDESVDFTRAYIATPTCSPSRASLLTGIEPVRFQMVRHITHADTKTGRNTEEFNYWEKDPANNPSRNWLPLEETTYAERLAELGYYNMFIGKWHLGHEPYHPIHNGFQEQVGTSNFGHPRNYYFPFFKNLNPLDDCREGDYLTDVLTDKSLDFINNYEKEQPFMLSLWYYTVHGPFHGRKDLLETYMEDGLDEQYANYAAMVSAMDESVGRIREALAKKGMAENTIILFLSDQGGAFKNGSLRGGKRGGFTLCEGGARVPFIVHYPGVTQAKQKCDIPVQSIDIYPTLIEMASGEKCMDKNINGKSLMPLLEGEKFAERNLYFYRSYEDQYAAVIHGDWKLIKYRSGEFELYNLKEDIGETTNLLDIEQDMAQKLITDIRDWEEEAVVRP